MKQGTIVIVNSDKVATVVYHGLDGYGIAWGRHSDQESYPMFDAMLRDPYSAAIADGTVCVGEDYEIMAEEEPKKFSGSSTVSGDERAAKSRSVQESL